MKISASIYANTFLPLKEIITELDAHHIDMFHIDCNDDLSVFKDIEKIKTYSSTPLDLHIISPYPSKFYSLIFEQNIDYVCFQYEAIKEKIILPTKHTFSKIGIAIKVDTDISVLKDIEKDIDFILLMCSTPGKSGGVFHKKSFQTIRALQKLYPNKKIHVDGGINAEISFVLRNLGIWSIVSGSYLMNDEKIGAAICRLKNQHTPSNIHIKDVMIPVQDLPILNDKSPLVEVLQTMDSYNYGFVFYVDENGIFKGISSNADLRKGLLKNIDNFHKTSITDIINTHPVCISPDATIRQLIKTVKQTSFPVLFLPVVNEKKILVGALTFNDLIKGEG